MIRNDEHINDAIQNVTEIDYEANLALHFI